MFWGFSVCSVTACVLSVDIYIVYSKKISIFLPPHCSVWLSHLCICPLLSYLARGIAFVLRLIHLFNCISQAQTRGGCHNHLLHCTCLFFFCPCGHTFSVFADICCLNFTLNGYESCTGDSKGSSDRVDSV